MSYNLDMIDKVYAIEGGITGSGVHNPLNVQSIPEFINKILEIIVQIGLPVVVVAFVYVGFLFVTAQGNEAKLSEAKKAFVWTAIGAAVVLGAFVISTAIKGTIDRL